MGFFRILIRMAIVYIIHSKRIDSFYIGCCLDISKRLLEHNTGKYSNSFTRKTNDWEIHYLIENVELYLALKIENHIKKMKSRQYLENLILYPQISTKLIEKYSTI